MVTKTAFAFQTSVQRLAEQSRNLYFWTFTFRHVPLNDEYAMADWAALNRRLEYYFPDLRGLRVCELHRSHGIHFHAILNRHVPIDKIRDICRGTGRLNGRNRYLDFGRMSVSRCDPGVAIYLSKYLTKQYRKENGFGRRRRWGTIGGFKNVKVRDVEVVDDLTRNKRKLFGKSQVYFGTMKLIEHYTALWGRVKNWPSEHLALVLRQRQKGDFRIVEGLKELADRKVCADFRESMEQARKKSVHRAGSYRDYASARARKAARQYGQKTPWGWQDWDGETGYELAGTESVQENHPF
jgi:hypothetical protein